MSSFKGFWGTEDFAYDRVWDTVVSWNIPAMQTRKFRICCSESTNLPGKKFQGSLTKQHLLVCPNSLDRALMFVTPLYCSQPHSRWEDMQLDVTAHQKLVFVSAPLLKESCYYSAIMILYKGSPSTIQQFTVLCIHTQTIMVCNHKFLYSLLHYILLPLSSLELYSHGFILN